MSDENPNDKQIGGSHYATGSEIQHWDWVEDCELGYLEGCATKYIARCRKKHDTPVIDLNKAVHYCEKIKQLYLTRGRANRRNPDNLFLSIQLSAFERDARLDFDEEFAIREILFWNNEYDLDGVITRLKLMIKRAEAA